MLYSVDEVEQGMTVYLTPHTKGASRACHEQRAVKVMHPPARFWPYVVVEWKQGNEKAWERVHKDNIRKKPPTPTAASGRADGDGTGGGRVDGKWQRKLAIGPPVKPLVLPEGVEQGELF